MNFPPAASQSALLEIDPARPNLGFTPHASCLFSLGGTHMFTCACHCAMLRGIRLSSSFQWAFLGAVYMTPISLYSSPVFSYSSEVRCSGLHGILSASPSQ